MRGLASVVLAATVLAALSVVDPAHAQACTNQTLSGERATILSAQCAFCDGKTEAQCKSTPASNDCYWETDLQLCVYKDTVSVVLKYIEQADEYELAESLVGAIDFCHRFYTVPTCYVNSSGRCEWDEDDNRCRSAEGLTSLLAFALQLDVATHQKWEQSARQCRAAGMIANTSDGCNAAAGFDFDTWIQDPTGAGTYPCAPATLETNKPMYGYCDVPSSTDMLFAAQPGIDAGIRADLLSEACEKVAGNNATRCATMATAFLDFCYFDSSTNECKTNDTRKDEYAAANPSSAMARERDIQTRCQASPASAGEAACLAVDPFCRWDATEDDECDLNEVGLILNVTGAVYWAQEYMNDFVACESNKNYSACSANGACEWRPSNSPSGEDVCIAHAIQAFPPALPGYDTCMREFANLSHALASCFSHANQTDCEASAKHPKYNCSWECGACSPVQSYFDDLTCTCSDGTGATGGATGSASGSPTGGSTTGGVSYCGTTCHSSCGGFCGYGASPGNYSGPDDCIICPVGYEIDVEHSDCTGRCVPAGEATTDLKESSCVFSNAQYPCSGGSNPTARCSGLSGVACANYEIPGLWVPDIDSPASAVLPQLALAASAAVTAVLFQYK